MFGISRLSSRERVRLALEHQTTDRIPIGMVCSGINPPTDHALDSQLRQTHGIDLTTFLRSIVDIREVQPDYVGPPLSPGYDIWGVKRKPFCYGAGIYEEIETHPLANIQTPADLKQHRFPDVSWFDYSIIPQRIAAANADGDHCIMAANANLFECAWYMRGFEQMMMDFILNPELAHAIMEQVTSFQVAHFKSILTAAKGQIDLVFTADDIGGQDGLLISLPMWREFLFPYHARLNRLIHEFGARVIYHSDGSVMPAVAGLIEMGIDVLQALQFSARGMDPARLKNLHGDRLCFAGGVSVQTTLPFGKVGDVRAEVEMLIRILGKDGGYILGPSHVIQAGTPVENILAMFETALNYYPHNQ